MKIKTLAIGLLTDRIDVILCAGAQAVDARRINLTIEQDTEKWGRQVREAGKAIRAAAQEMGAIGLHARVFYRGPGACAEFASPRARNASEAVSAAVLACADSLACPIDAAASRGFVVSFDKNDAEAKAQVVVAADGDDSLTAISEMVSSAGLKFKSATPLDAVSMAMLGQQAAGEAKESIAFLHFGEHRSFLVIAAKQSLLFARPISVGLDTLLGSLKRPIRLNGGQTIDLNHETARAILHECGFPSRSQVVNEELQLTGGQIVPVLQPVLQRFMVELRQSLRFALPENQRQGVLLKLCGPGAKTPGFQQIAADELGVKVDIDETQQPYDYRDPMSPGSELIAALAGKRAAMELELEPLNMSRQRRMRQMQRWMWAGAAAALAMIGFDMVRYQGRVGDLRKQADALQSQSEGLAALKATSEKLLAASDAMTALDNTMRKEIGARVCMGALMQELSRVTPPSIRLYNIAFKPGNGVTIIGGLSGYAMDDASDPSETSRLLETYMQQLGESPLMSRLSLANVQTSVIGSSPAQSFDVSFDAVAAQADALPAIPALAGAEKVEE